jgi:hypothetical protein
MSNIAASAGMGLIATVWGYIVYREISRGEFRRWGMDGWFRRKDHPRDFVFCVSTHVLGLVIMVWATIWTLLGKPNQ